MCVRTYTLSWGIFWDIEKTYIYNNTGIFFSRSGASGLEAMIGQQNTSGTRHNAQFVTSQVIPVNTWFYLICRITASTFTIFLKTGTYNYTTAQPSEVVDFNAARFGVGALMAASGIANSFNYYDLRDFLYYDSYLSDTQCQSIASNFTSQYGLP